MAKSRSIFNITGTLNGLTHVDSATYGKHVRAARGTYTAVEVNEAFKETSKQLVSANLPAKMIKDAIDPYRRDFGSGAMWSQLVSIFRMQAKGKGAFNFRALQNFEFNKNYPLQRLITFDIQVSSDYLQSQVMITLDYKHHPHFKESYEIDAYRVSVIAMYPDLKRKKTTTYNVELPLIKLTDKVEPLSVAIPQHTDVTLLCIKVEGAERDRVLGGLSLKGMAIVKVIEVGV